MTEYEKYEKECEKIREENTEYLRLFAEDLKGKVSEKTAQRHVENADFFINEYLLREDANPIQKGITKANSFFGSFYIRKCMWSTPGNLKSTAASIKKFYKCMMEHGKIDHEDYEFLCAEIMEGLPFWQEDCARYNDPEEDYFEDEFSWLEGI